MQSVRALLVDAFTDDPLAGNAAGVVPDADGLTDGQMQAVARELSVSETAFVVESESDEADRRLRYFSPTREVDLCGHATVATHAHLFEDGVLEAGTHAFETNVGTLSVELEADGVVWMRQQAPSVRPVSLEYDRVAGALGVETHPLAEMREDLPLAVASTGLPFLMVPATYLQVVGSADPDFDAVEDLTDEVDAAGLYLFTFDALDPDANLHGRAFCPGLGIPEDPVTGTASGAVAGYLDHYAAFQPSPDELLLEQGHYVDRPGTVRVRVDDRVSVGGRAVTSLDGTLTVAADEEDDILEV